MPPPVFFSSGDWTGWTHIWPLQNVPRKQTSVSACRCKNLGRSVGRSVLGELKMRVAPPRCDKERKTWMRDHETSAKSRRRLDSGGTAGRHCIEEEGSRCCNFIFRRKQKINGASVFSERTEMIWGMGASIYEVLTEEGGG